MTLMSEMGVTRIDLAIVDDLFLPDFAGYRLEPRDMPLMETSLPIDDRGAEKLLTIGEEAVEVYDGTTLCCLIPVKARWGLLFDSGLAIAKLTEDEDVALETIVIQWYDLRGQLRAESAEFEFIAASSLDPNRIAVKYGDDAIVIEVGEHGLSHVAVIPAFAYVQAGRESKKHMVFSRHYAILAEVHGHIFIYAYGQVTQDYAPMYICSVGEDISQVIMHSEQELLISTASGRYLLCISKP